MPWSMGASLSRRRWDPLAAVLLWSTGVGIVRLCTGWCLQRWALYPPPPLRSPLQVRYTPFPRLPIHTPKHYCHRRCPPQHLPIGNHQRRARCYPHPFPHRLLVRYWRQRRILQPQKAGDGPHRACLMLPYSAPLLTACYTRHRTFPPPSEPPVWKCTTLNDAAASLPLCPLLSVLRCAAVAHAALSGACGPVTRGGGRAALPSVCPSVCYCHRRWQHLSTIEGTRAHAPSRSSSCFHATIFYPRSLSIG